MVVEIAVVLILWAVGTFIGVMYLRIKHGERSRHKWERYQ